ncbi:Lrp/AsnC family transcriptional regulator [Pacificibacter marinus]|uniref:Leucine-responsive regulatory protein n=1 Tax=Pacificibacter marinus TaxID=658057 RepID=A0A1Y5SR67_9RHOB|nr:Lrp/AsnC family transcriptional regulator [Pacificibacter marinus]SEK67951.1 transcriptional regulator, AsnC family [Pacificibacter marinus]SLN46110.1 Leucine-responsive regulatory protein [Pacificibacter marinus]
MDKIDDHILRTLARDGRLTNLQLADQIGLSPSATSRRVADLERSGVITGYRAVIDQSKVGLGFVAYVTVGLSKHTKESQEAFERAISQAPQVKECHNVTGVFEYILRVETADLSAYKVFHTDVLGVLPQVNSITSYIVMESPKDLRA